MRNHDCAFGPKALLIADGKNLSQFFLQRFCHLGIFLVGKIHLLGVHPEHTAEVGTVLVLGDEVEVQMLQSVGIGSIVDFCGIEYLLHGSCHIGHIGHERVALVAANQIKVVNMSVVCNTKVWLFMENTGIIDDFIIVELKFIK